MSGLRFALWFAIVVAAVAAIGYRMSVFREAPPPPMPKVAFVASGPGPYWQAAVTGAKAAGRDHRVKLQLEIPEGSESAERQTAILGMLGVGEFDGVALSPVDPERKTPLINQMVRDGKKVVTFDSDAPLSDRQSYIGTNNLDAGRACATLAKEAAPEGGKVAVLLANLSKQNMLDRKQGFEERINDSDGKQAEEPAPKFEVVGYFADNGNSERCATIIRDTLAEHPDLTCFVGMTARSGPVLLKVLGETDKLGQIKVIAFDDANETLDGIEAGHIYATVAQDPYKYGYEAVATLAALCRGDETGLPVVGKGSIYMHAEPIKQENLGEFRARLYERQQAAPSSGDKKAA